MSDDFDNFDPLEELHAVEARMAKDAGKNIWGRKLQVINEYRQQPAVDPPKPTPIVPKEQEIMADKITRNRQPFDDNQLAEVRKRFSEPGGMAALCRQFNCSQTKVRNAAMAMGMAGPGRGKHLAKQPASRRPGRRAAEPAAAPRPAAIAASAPVGLSAQLGTDPVLNLKLRVRIQGISVEVVPED